MTYYLEQAYPPPPRPSARSHIEQAIDEEAVLEQLEAGGV
jgi:hypothetical protein